MITTIKLNSDDIKELIAKKFDVDKEKIDARFWGASQDGLYYSSGGCSFSFDIEKRDI